MYKPKPLEILISTIDQAIKAKDAQLKHIAALETELERLKSESLNLSSLLALAQIALDFLTDESAANVTNEAEPPK